MSPYAASLGRFWMLCVVGSALGCSHVQPTQAASPVCVGYARDFDVFWQTMRDEYVFFPEKKTDWSVVRERYRPTADTASSPKAWLGILEHSIDALYDAHLSARVNSRASPRLVPSGLDLWAEWRNGSAIVTSVREGFGAARAGVTPGMEVVEIGGRSVHSATRERIDPSIITPDSSALVWALLSALAGRRDQTRVLVVRIPGGHLDTLNLDALGPPSVDNPPALPLVEWRMLTDSVGYIRLNDLTDTRAVTEFDTAIAGLRHARALVLDLRNTPQGGNTDVAEPILGRFIARTMKYQRVVPRRAAGYDRSVGSRGPWQYTAPLAVLVGRWTGSMGEGMAIGIDGMRRGTVVGSRMAGLAGAVEEIRLPCSHFVVGYPAARLLHLDGTPRESYRPRIEVVPRTRSGTGDDVLTAALELLRSH